MRFDGDIIITDPCYIINEDNTVTPKFPNASDYISKMTVDEYGRNKMPKASDYPDVRIMIYEDYIKDVGGDRSLARMLYVKDVEQKNERFWSDTLYEERQKYAMAIVDYHSTKRDDWELCEYGEDMSAIGIKNCVTSDTGCGDWSCTVFEENSNKELGEFCADAGMVGVFLLDDVLKYNPKFDYHTEKPWTTTLIKDFHGEVDIITNENDEVEVVGVGNINFKSKQTGF